MSGTEQVAAEVAGSPVLAARLAWRALRYRYKLNPRQIRAMGRYLGRGGIGLDIGAHKGAYSCLMAWRVGESGRVIAVEPQTRLVGKTAASLRSLGLRQVKLIHAAVSDRSGEAMIAVRRSSTHGASIEGLSGDDIEQQPVVFVTIDELAQREGLGRLDFVKIDVEGHELAVLRGGLKTLAKYGPAILVEIEARHHDGAAGAGAEADPLAAVRELLAPMGYRGVFFGPTGERPLEEFSFSEHQDYSAAKAGKGQYCNDFLFVRGG